MPEKPENHITVCAIAALTKNERVIGKDGDLPWRKIKKDMKRFVSATRGKPVIMGRRTWESISEKYRPLPDRPNIVITTQDDYEASGATTIIGDRGSNKAPKKALKKACQLAKKKNVGEVFVIGGESIYKALLPQTDKLILTLIDKDIDGDTYFPPYKGKFTNKHEEGKHEENDLSFTFVTLTR